MSLGKSTEALNLMRKCAEVMKEILGPRHADYIIIKNLIGILLIKLGLFEESLLNF